MSAILCFLIACCQLAVQAVWFDDPKTVEYFESYIRPVLVERCYECHNSTTTAESDLALDSRQGWITGGQSGPAIEPGNAAGSLLFQAIEPTSADWRMPPAGEVLTPVQVEAFRKWIDAGAIDPRDHPPSAEEMQKSGSWAQTMLQRKQWWSFQPIRRIALPRLDLSKSPIDQLIESKLQQTGITSSPRASNDVLIRRLFIQLVGMPATIDEFKTWHDRLSATQDPSAQQTILQDLVDHLLADKRFGERWARHWMDWTRYAESHGSEGDPMIANAWMYRDYLIRSLNQSIPLDQMIREHIAGDLLDPRYDPVTGLNESLIATAHWRMVFHGFAPTDALDERVRFIDDQINAFSKAFLGLTVSCARCHDHKFDPISQRDYYAIFGVLNSCRPGRSTAGDESSRQKARDELRQLKNQIRSEIASSWLDSEQQLRGTLHKAARAVFAKSPQERTADESAFWARVLGPADPEAIRVPQVATAPSVAWDLSRQADRESWYRVGIGAQQSQPLGDFSPSLTGPRVIEFLHSTGLSTRLISDKDAGRISSPDFVGQKDSVLWVHAAGDGAAAVRYVVQNYPRNGTVYPIQTLTPALKWYRFDIGYWAGDQIHVELTTALDAPLLTGNQERSWFQVDRVEVLPRGVEPMDATPSHIPQSASLTEAVERSTHAVPSAIRAWQSASSSPAEAELLSLALRLDYLSNDQTSSPLREAVERYRQIESELPVAIRVPCLQETVGYDVPLFIRGDHHRPDELVPRKFLEALDPRPFQTAESGRRELANAILDITNPLTPRVMANHIWHHLMGVGIVATPDNFGRLGALPSNPDLLDWLALDLVESGWSLKSLIRKIVLSDTWQRSSVPTSQASAIDPQNQLLSHANLRRYEAEVVRDALLLAAGSLSLESFGPPENLDSRRRSIYLPVIRNNLVPLLRTFDFPEPFSSVGRRDQTNVPAQSLSLLNDPQVQQLASDWAQRTIFAHQTDAASISQMWMTAFNREPNAEELRLLDSQLADTRSRLKADVEQLVALGEALKNIDQQATEFESTIRSRILEKRGELDTSRTSPQDLPSLPKPVWEFSVEDGKILLPIDQYQLVGDVQVLADSIHVGGGGYLASSKLSTALAEKTLVAVVQLDDLDQRGGGVVSVQSMDGSTFDSIVFGEQTPQHWMAGSNSFTRTRSFQGEPENAAKDAAVHLAIAYRRHGNIQGFRNGLPYGTSYQSAGIQEFTPGHSLVTLGLRHLPATGNRSLSGRVYYAAIYDRDLSEEQISTIASRSHWISQDELLANMSPGERSRWEQIQAQLQQFQDQFATLSRALQMDDADRASVSRDSDTLIEHLAWTELARTLFTLKEFIYVP